MISTFYYRIWMNDLTGHVTILSEHFVLEDACKARQLTGDLIVDDRGMLINPELWMFEYEKHDPGCYPYKKWLWQQQTQQPLNLFDSL